MHFCKIGLSKLTSIFDPILTPIWLHFGTKNPSKSNKKSIPRGIKKMIDFCIDFLSILARFWEPSWSHVGHFFAQNTDGLTEGRGFFVGSSFFIDLLAVLAPFWRLWTPSGLNVRRFLVSCWLHFCCEVN